MCATSTRETAAGRLLQTCRKAPWQVRLFICLCHVTSVAIVYVCNINPGNSGGPALADMQEGTVAGKAVHLLMSRDFSRDNMIVQHNRGSSGGRPLQTCRKAPWQVRRIVQLCLLAYNGLLVFNAGWRSQWQVIAEDSALFA
jgi:hypothetical protein